MPDPLPLSTIPLYALDGMGRNLVTTDSLRNPIVRDHITDLQTALDLCIEGNDSLYRTRFMIELPRAHIAPQFLLILYSWLVDNKRPHYIHTHDSSQSADEKVEILAQSQRKIQDVLGIETPPLPIKTVTLQYDEQGSKNHILVTGVGDFRVEKEKKRKIAQELGISNSVMKAAVINPKGFSTTISLGLIPGIVGPVLESHLVLNINGIFYFFPTDPNVFVELAVSPVDSLILQADDFKDNLRAYAQAAYFGYNIVEQPDYFFFKRVKTLGQ